LTATIEVTRRIANSPVTLRRAEESIQHPTRRDKRLWFISNAIKVINDLRHLAEMTYINLTFEVI